MWHNLNLGSLWPAVHLEEELNEVQSVAASAPIGYLMLSIAVVTAVCAICDFLEFGVKRVAEKKGFSNPQLHELMESFRMWGMRASTYSLVKGIFFTAMLVFTLYAGKPAISNLFASWFG